MSCFSSPDYPNVLRQPVASSYASRHYRSQNKIVYNLFNFFGRVRNKRVFNIGWVSLSKQFFNLINRKTVILLLIYNQLLTGVKKGLNSHIATGRIIGSRNIMQERQDSNSIAKFFNFALILRICYGRRNSRFVKFTKHFRCKINSEIIYSQINLSYFPINKLLLVNSC